MRSHSTDLYIRNTSPKARFLSSLIARGPLTRGDGSFEVPGARGRLRISPSPVTLYNAPISQAFAQQRVLARSAKANQCCRTPFVNTWYLRVKRGIPPPKKKEIYTEITEVHRMVGRFFCLFFLAGERGYCVSRLLSGFDCSYFSDLVEFSFFFERTVLYFSRSFVLNGFSTH